MFKQLLKYFKDSKEEMKKVTWPSKKETQNYTYLVFGVSVAVATFLGTLDYIFTVGLEALIK